MKVLRLTTLLDFGGQEKKYISFTERPDLLHFDYEFAAIGYGGNAEKILKERGFAVHILDRKFSIKNLSNIWTVYQLIRKVKPDVVHTAAAEANFHGIIAAKLAGVKIIIGEEIGIPNHSKTAEKVFSFLYQLADQVVCVSKAVKKNLLERGEISNKQGIVIYNPAHTPKQNFEKQISPFFEMVYIGRLEKVKNVRLLIEALAIVNDPSIRLKIVGDGRERQSLENLANELKIENQIFFEGFSNNPNSYLANADLFVLSSFSEGFGIAVVEAMLMKVPVLCSKVGGIPEFVEDGKTGWLFNPNDKNELASKIIELKKEEAEKLKKVGSQGYQSVKNVFTEEKYVENLENLYGKLYQQKN